MSHAVRSEQLLGRNGLKQFKERQETIDQLRKRRLIRKTFLKDQILNHDRIDLLMTEVLGYEVKDFHLALYYGVTHNSLVISNTKNKRQKWNLTLAPRGFGKSTCLNVARCILEVLKNPNIRILIASKTDTNSVAFLSEIKQKLLRPEVEAIFGPQKGSPWNDGNIRVASRTADFKEDCIETVGIGGALASKHYDLIIADDLVDEFNSLTSGQREKIRKWFFKVLDPTLMTHGEMSIIGTRYDPDDLYDHLISNIFTKKNSRGRVIKKHYQVLPALLDLPNGEKASLWPEVASVEFLEKKKKILGSIIFNSQYQNSVEEMSGEYFKREWIQYYKVENIKLEELLIYQGVDLASKQAKDADRFAVVTIGVDKKTKDIFVLDYYNGVTHFSEQKRIVKEKFNKYDPIRVAIEDIGYQRVFLQELKTNESLQHIRACPALTNGEPKEIRARKLSAYFERKQVFFRHGMTEMVEQLLRFGKYKDLFDALDFAVNTAFYGIRKTRKNEPGLI